MYTPHFLIINDDCLHTLREMEDNTVDALITDPPAGISMMSKAWDNNKGGRDKWIEWLSSIMEEALRVLKPGAHGLVWSLPRTSHWTGMALEKAGFEIRDKITHYFSNQECAEKFWTSLDEEQRKLFLLALPDESGVEHLFGSGFAKSLDVSKKIDKHFGAEREVVGRRHHPTLKDVTKIQRQNSSQYHATNPIKDEWDITAPATEQAKQWEGWGTALSPGAEHWWLVRKPFKGTVVQNVLEHGTGGIDIDRSRVKVKGRRPKNVIFSHHSSCECIGKKRVKGSGTSKETHPIYKGEPATNFYRSNSYSGNYYGDLDLDGVETVEDWECAAECNECGYSWKSEKVEPGRCPECKSFDTRWLCPVKALDIQANKLKSGGGVKTLKGSNESMSGWKEIRNQGPKYDASKGNASRYFKTFETEDWHCAAGCPCGYIWATEELTKCPECGCHKTKWVCTVKLLSEQSGKLKSGALAGQIRKDNKNVYGKRFFYCAKASTKDRTCDGKVENKHPTVKSQKLMKYLVKLITPPKGVVLDPFMGSGSTGLAALSEDRTFIGMEKDEESFDTALARLRAMNFKGEKI